MGLLMCTPSRLPAAAHGHSVDNPTLGKCVLQHRLYRAREASQQGRKEGTRASGTSTAQSKRLCRWVSRMKM
jgi:hypothetical protein